MGINSVIGSYLDPLADKVVQTSPPSNFIVKRGMLFLVHLNLHGSRVGFDNLFSPWYRF